MGRRWLTKLPKGVALLLFIIFFVLLLFTDYETSAVTQYRGVMEDFYGEKEYTNWSEDINEVETKVMNYPKEGYIKRPIENRTVKKWEFYIFGFSFSPLNTFLDFFEYNLSIFLNISYFVLFSLFLVFIWVYLNDITLFFKKKASFVEKSRLADSSKDIIKRIKNKIQEIKSEKFFEDIGQKTEKIFPKSVFEPLIIFSIWFFVSICIFRKLQTLLNGIKVILPYFLGAIATSVVINALVSIVLVISENIETGDMIKFEDQIGRIEKLGFIYTCIRTPKNEKIYVPNIMLSTKTMQKLSKRKIRGIKPYITRFKTTLSYKIPFGVVNSLFFLAIRDTADDLENDFRKGRIGRGLECIRSLENLDKKIDELTREKEKIEKKIENESTYKGCPYELSTLKREKTIVDKRIKELEIQRENYEEYTPYVLIRKLDNYTVNYEFCVFTDHPFHLLKINHYLMKNLKRRFDEFEIEIMSPLQISKREFNE